MIPTILHAEPVTPEAAGAWRGRVLTTLSRRDRDDLFRIEARLGQATLVRYIAAGYMEAMFSSGAEREAFRAFGLAVESAYQTLVAALNAVRDAKRAEEERDRARRVAVRAAMRQTT